MIKKLIRFWIISFLLSSKTRNMKSNTWYLLPSVTQLWRVLKVTSATKLFVIKQQLMCNYWIFLFEEKIMFRSRDIEIFVFLRNLQISKFVTSSQVLLHNASYTYAYFFRILSPIKMKFGQILVCCMKNISKMFLAQCWRLETSSRFFYDSIKTTIQQDLVIFDCWHILFLIVLYSPFQKYETQESWHIWLLSNWGRLLN